MDLKIKQVGIKPKIGFRLEEILETSDIVLIDTSATQGVCVKSRDILSKPLLKSQRSAVVLELAS